MNTTNVCILQQIYQNLNNLLKRRVPDAPSTDDAFCSSRFDDRIRVELFAQHSQLGPILVCANVCATHAPFSIKGASPVHNALIVDGDCRSRLKLDPILRVGAGDCFVPCTESAVILLDKVRRDVIQNAAVIVVPSDLVKLLGMWIMLEHWVARRGIRGKKESSFACCV